MKAIKDAGIDKSKINDNIGWGSTRIPAIQVLLKKSLTGPNKSVDPDEVVALGAAIQGGVLLEMLTILLLTLHPFP